VAPADVDADRERAVRVERDRHRGLADLAALGREAPHQTVGLEPLGDGLHRGRGEMGQPCEVGLRQVAVQADRLQHHPLVELAHAHVVGAARAQARFGIGNTGVGHLGNKRKVVDWLKYRA
jgi:hypothetical protein